MNSNTLEILPLTDHLEFVEELAELHHREWTHLNPALTVQKRAKAIAAAAGRDGIPSFFIAVSGGQLVGSAAIVLNDMRTKPELSPWLAAVYVKEQFRQQGVAKKLIARCEDEAHRSGATTWYLYTEFASTLYEKLGWHYLERCQYKGVMVDVMCKHITN